MTRAQRLLLFALSAALILEGSLAQDRRLCPYLASASQDLGIGGLAMWFLFTL